MPNRSCNWRCSQVWQNFWGLFMLCSWKTETTEISPESDPLAVPGKSMARLYRISLESRQGKVNIQRVGGVCALVALWCGEIPREWSWRIWGSVRVLLTLWIVCWSVPLKRAIFGSGGRRWLAQIVKVGGAIQGNNYSAKLVSDLFKCFSHIQNIRNRWGTFAWECWSPSATRCSTKTLLLNRKAVNSLMQRQTRFGKLSTAFTETATFLA